ncbi:MAG: type II toxin-antitoxin system VapC family toxin [Pirellulales bacterium]
MSAVFADTSFFVAFLHEDDADHDAAKRLMANHEGEIVTTEWVVVELGNFLSRRAKRTYLQPFVADLVDDPRFEIRESDRNDFHSGLQLYHERRDKHWSMTDCISFNLMEREGMTDALTSDHHFEQAGFRILLGN